VARTSPAGDEIQLAADHVAATVGHLERRIQARFGERGLTKAARDLGHLVVSVQRQAEESHDRLRRTTLVARGVSITIVAVTLAALVYSLRSVVIDGLARTADWVPLVESIINDLVFASKDPEQLSPTYAPTEQSIVHGLDADQLYHYLGYCSEMLSLTAKTAALCGEYSTDSVVLETISYIETLTTELSDKIWQKISLLPRP
jgi:hypothetical protein